MNDGQPLYCEPLPLPIRHFCHFAPSLAWWLNFKAGPASLRQAVLDLVHVHESESSSKVWRVNLRERRATIWMRSVSRLGDDARHLIVAGLLYAGGWLSLGFGMPTFFGVA